MPDGRHEDVPKGTGGLTDPFLRWPEGPAEAQKSKYFEAPLSASL